MEIKCYQKNESYESMIVHFVDHNINDIEIICLCEFHVEIILIHIDMENKMLSRRYMYRLCKRNN